MVKKRLICALVVVALVIVGLHFETKLLMHKDSNRRFDAYYEEPAAFDVIFLGNSHVMNGVTPLELWDGFGIPAYNMGLPGGRVANAYWTLQMTLQYSTPKLVVLDCAYLYAKSKVNRAYIHTLFDAMPMTKVKLEAAEDLYDGNLRYLFERVLVPFIRYHSRWAELEDEDFHSVFPRLMGYSLKDGAVRVERPAQLMADSPEPVQSVNTDYLERIIQECEERNIALLLTYIPFHANEEDQNEAGYLATFAEERGLDYLTPEQLASAIDWDCDFGNGSNGNNSHLNHRGAKKLTRYIGEYISGHYDLQDRRSEVGYAQWADYYRDYLDYEDQELQDATQWYRLLTLLSNDRYDLVVEAGDPTLWQDEQFEALMNGIGLGSEALADGPATFWLEADRQPRRIEQAELEASGVETELGHLRADTVQLAEGAGYAVMLEDVSLFEAAHDERPAVRIAVLDREKGVLLRSAQLTLYHEGKIKLDGE